METFMSIKTANTLRLLAAEMVQKANSGHPGLPMGMADVAAVLWTQFLNYNPGDPEWPARDRFVMSGGHGSSLLYAALHLAGYDYSLDDLKNFRQWGSKTPGHPEKHLPGVETTTGPLGQGFTNAVGLALAAKISAEQWNTKDHELFGQNFTYCFCGDGDMMEGISHEAASLAGHLGLEKLLCFYDSNKITIDGSTDLAFTEDVATRFKAYHWHVQEIDGHDHEEIATAIEAAQCEKDLPSLIIAKTHIGFGSPNKQGTSAAHGAPLGEDELKLTKKALDFPPEESFYIPDEVREEFRLYRKKLLKRYDTWYREFDAWKNENQSLYIQYNHQKEKIFPENLSNKLMKSLSGKESASRAHSGNIIQFMAKEISGLIGGSADLGASDKTTIKGGGSLLKGSYSAKNIHYGIREFAMSAIMNGLALYGTGIIPFAGTFLVFSDYMRSGIRMAALMKQQVIYVFTHDSIFVGEDGPTHQPIEQIMSLRLIPGLQVMRPADEKETAEAWLAALEYKNGPTALVLTRQNLPEIHKGEESIQNFSKGAFLVYDCEDADATIIASGSEVSISLDAIKELAKDGLNLRLISAPCLDNFNMQEQSYREKLIPKDMPLITVEAGRTIGWGEYGSSSKLHIGIDHFGASAPYKVLADKYGFTAEAVYNKIKNWLPGVLAK